MTDNTKQQEQEKIETSEYSTGFSTLDYREFAQSRRIHYIQRIEEATKGNIEELEPDVQGHYLAALRDLEKQTIVIEKMKQDRELAEMRLKVDQQNNAAINQNIAVLLNEAARKRGRGQTISKDEIIFDINLVPEKQLIPGETTLGDQIETYLQFQNRTGLVDDQDL